MIRWTYHPPVPAHLGKLCGIALGHLKPIPGDVPTEWQVPSLKKLMAGSWWCDFSKWSWDCCWCCCFCLLPGHVQQGQGSLSLVKKDETPAEKKKNDFWWLNLLNMVKPPFPPFLHSCLLRFKRKNKPCLKKKKRTGFDRLNIPMNVSCSPPNSHTCPHPPQAASCATRCAAPPPSEPRCVTRSAPSLWVELVKECNRDIPSGELT